MSERTEMSPGQADDLDKGSDKDNDKDLASTRRDTPRAIDKDSGADPSRERQAERQAEQENALQQWETEGGAEDRTDGNEVAEVRRTDTGEQDG
jgi:hypothetical protein